MSRRTLPLWFPTGGMVRRLAYQKQPPYTTPSCSNVRPDDTILGRERGGSRPGLGKAYALQMGSGNPIRLIASCTFTPSAGGASITRMFASSNGLFYREEPVGTMELVSSSLTLASDIQLQADDFQGDLYIADYDEPVISRTNGVVTGTTSFTSSGNFSGVNANDYALVMTDGGTGSNEVQTITITGTPAGGTFRLTVSTSEDSYETIPIPYDASGANVANAINHAIGATAVTGGGGALPGTPVTITFDGTGYTNTTYSLITADGSGLTGGTLSRISVARTTTGGGADEQTYTISAVSGDTITLTISPATVNATGISFRIQRVPKVYDPVANTISKMTATEGSMPIGRPLFCIWRGRGVWAGGMTDPHGYDMSRIGDMLDFDYSQTDDSGAVAGSTADAGKLQTPCTALIPHSDDCLIFGCISQTWIMRNDPKAGGNLTRLSSEHGPIDMLAWTYTPEGYLFMVALDGLYVMAPGCGSTPKSVSREKLPEELLNLDRTTHTVLMRYDVRDRGIHLYVTQNTV